MHGWDHSSTLEPCLYAKGEGELFLFDLKHTDLYSISALQVLVIPCRMIFFKTTYKLPLQGTDLLDAHAKNNYGLALLDSLFLLSLTLD